MQAVLMSFKASVELSCPPQPPCQPAGSVCPRPRGCLWRKCECGGGRPRGHCWATCFATALVSPDDCGSHAAASSHHRTHPRPSAHAATRCMPATRCGAASLARRPPAQRSKRRCTARRCEQPRLPREAAPGRRLARPHLVSSPATLVTTQVCGCRAWAEQCSCLQLGHP